MAGRGRKVFVNKNRELAFHVSVRFPVTFERLVTGAMEVLRDQLGRREREGRFTKLRSREAFLNVCRELYFANGAGLIGEEEGCGVLSGEWVGEYWERRVEARVRRLFPELVNDKDKE